MEGRKVGPLCAGAASRSDPQLAGGMPLVFSDAERVRLSTLHTDLVASRGGKQRVLFVDMAKQWAALEDSGEHSEEELQQEVRRLAKSFSSSRQRRQAVTHTRARAALLQRT